MLKSWIHTGASDLAVYLLKNRLMGSYVAITVQPEVQSFLKAAASVHGKEKVMEEVS